MDSTYYESGYVEEGFFGVLKSGEGEFTTTAQFTVGAIVHTGDYFVYDYIEDGYFEPKFNVVDASAALSAVSNLTAITGYLLSGGADLRSEFIFTADSRELNINTFVWLVPAESRSYTVTKETRQFTVPSELRTWRVE